MSRRPRAPAPAAGRKPRVAASRSTLPPVAASSAERRPRDSARHLLRCVHGTPPSTSHAAAHGAAIARRPRARGGQEILLLADALRLIPTRVLQGAKRRACVQFLRTLTETLQVTLLKDFQVGLCTQLYTASVDNCPRKSVAVGARQVNHARHLTNQTHDALPWTAGRERLQRAGITSSRHHEAIPCSHRTQGSRS